MTMIFKKLDDGFEIPIIGLGTWLQKNEPECINAVKSALDIGYRHIDTADIYENHGYIAKAIKGFTREKLFITTKLWKDFMDPKQVESQCDKCLMQLNLDYLDLYLIHWPDRTKPMNDIIYQMTKLKERGKVKSIGVSNFTINHLQDILHQGLKIEMNQVEFHPFLNQPELLDFCNRHAIAITAYSPIARGNVFHDPDINSISVKYKRPANQIALRWLLQKDIVAIPKATSKEHLESNFKIFDFQLDPDDMKKIDNIGFTRPKRLINPEFADFEY
ncbi:MAG: aldo/keto reductase [Parachlamydiales bacterium]|nr:aldo/keto reductase [Parachlamydiales bacterium]